MQLRIGAVQSGAGCGVGIAQLVEHPTEKPGAILTEVHIPGAARDFLPSQFPVQTV